jgi:hypothetical protein
MKTAITLIIVFCAAALAQDRTHDALKPPAKLKLDLPSTAPVTQPASQPAVKESYVPKLPVRPDRRAAKKLAPVRDPQPPVELPALPPANNEVPARVSFDEPAPYRAASVPSITLRLPNLIGAPRRAMWQSTNPSITPSPAVSTNTVNNLEGTAALRLMPPFTRKLTIDLAPIPAPLAVGEEPYVQSPIAPDDADIPLTSSAPAPIKLD